MSPASSWTLRHDLVVVTRPAGASEDQEEVVKRAGEAISLRRPKARDLKIMDRFEGKEIEGTIHLIAALSGLDLHQAEALDGEDFAGLGELVGDFAGSGQKTGATA